MNAQQALTKTDWRSEWFEFEDVAYMNTAGQAALPKLRFAPRKRRLSGKNIRTRCPTRTCFALPARVRELIAEMIGAQPVESRSRRARVPEWRPWRKEWNGGPVTKC